MFNFFKKPENNKEKGFFKSLKDAVAKTSDALINSVLDVVSNKDEIDDFALDDVESALIKADLGVDLAVEIVEKIKDSKLKPADIKPFLRNFFEEILDNSGSSSLKYESGKLNIYFVVGVNGAGKTTLIGKLAYKFKNEGKRVLLGAGDTFRAGAEEQLDVWSKRAGVDILREDKIESSAIAYKSIEKAQNEGYDVLIIDTAGRLQNKFNLIEELKKVKGIIDKKAPEANLESILVLDANLGQNGLAQAKVFKEAVNLTGVALTKLDGSSKGGIIFAVAREYNIPVKLIGVGEKIEDIRDFNKKEFIEAIF